MTTEDGCPITQDRLRGGSSPVYDGRGGNDVDRNRLEQLEKLWAMDPSDPVVGLGLGTGLLEAQEFARARDVLEMIIQKKPEYAAAWEVLGKTLEAMGDRDQAIRVYREGIAISRAGGFLAPEKQMSRRLRRLIRTTRVEGEESET